MFEKIQGRSVDDLIATMKAVHADGREHKVDLVIGVYKDEARCGDFSSNLSVLVYRA